MLLFILTIYDVAALVKIQSLATSDSQRRPRSIVHAEELLNILTSDYARTLIVKEWGRVPLQDTYVEVFP